MIAGRFLAVLIVAATLVLIITGTIWPVRSAIAMAGFSPQILRSSNPEAAVQNLVEQIGGHRLHEAYSSLANKSEFTESEFVRDLKGTYLSLRSNADLEGYDVRPLHASGDEARIRAILHWSTVLGTFDDVRDLRLTKAADKWQVAWPLVKEPRVPPQVVPVNYLRWDVIYRGPEDDWGAQDVEAPHVRIVDMHPVERSAGVVLLGEVLNEDVVPAYVSVKATLLAGNGSAMATEDSFDNISHILLPKQVSPFRIDFPNVRLSQVDSVRIQPASSLIGASADPVIAIQDQHLVPLPESSLRGDLVNQSGQVVNVAHVLATFYGNGGQLVWVSGSYVDRALLPQTPVPFAISLPADLSAKVSNFRVVTSTYSLSRLQ